MSFCLVIMVPFLSLLGPRRPRTRPRDQLDARTTLDSRDIKSPREMSRISRKLSPKSQSRRQRVEAAK